MFCKIEFFFIGSWPAIWMMGQNKYPWPNMGEIDIVEVVNGDPSVVESLHSPAHHGGNPQHPPNQPVRTNANLNDHPLIAGMEWNIQVNHGLFLCHFYRLPLGKSLLARD